MRRRRSRAKGERVAVVKCVEAAALGLRSPGVICTVTSRRRAPQDIEAGLAGARKARTIYTIR